jgi:hypothetical protein
MYIYIYIYLFLFYLLLTYLCPVTLYSLEENLNELQKKNIDRDDNVIFSYGEIAERTLVVSWETRYVLFY